MIVDGQIRCCTCRQEKQVADFYPAVAAKGHGSCRACRRAVHNQYNAKNREKVNARGLRSYYRHRDEILERRRQHVRKPVGQETMRDYNLRRYGLTAVGYDRMLALQGGSCACCGSRSNKNGKRLYVDHDHQTGAVRGLICHRCNAGIGALGDTVAGVQCALAYLKRSQPRPVEVTFGAPSGLAFMLGRTMTTVEREV